MSTADASAMIGRIKGRCLEKHAPTAEMLQSVFRRKEAYLSVEKSLELIERNQQLGMCGRKSGE
jgi:hypothetical protein